MFLFLEGRTEDFGKQILWTSIGWGVSSMVVGWLVDMCSVNKTEKNYSPVFYSSIILAICNVVISNKIKVRYLPSYIY